MYMIPHIVNNIYYNLCNLFDNIYVVKICWIAMKLQVMVAIQKPSCKANYKST
jgi:hypothetical protein